MRDAERDDRGRFIEWERWERPCVCGHTLGDHTAAQVEEERPCIVHETQEGAGQCQCRRFRPSRKKPAKETS